MSTALPTPVSQATAKRRKSRVRQVEFGNGYFATSPDGYNRTYQEWNISYTGVGSLSNITKSALDTFLDTVDDGSLISWTPPGGSAGYYKLQGDVTEVPLAGDIWNVSFTIRQTFEVPA